MVVIIVGGVMVIVVQIWVVVVAVGVGAVRCRRRVRDGEWWVIFA